jgi:ribosomal protein S18 acetylase RimI-like enzyme
MGDPSKRKKFIADLPRQDRVNDFKKIKHMRFDDGGMPPYVEPRAKRVQAVLKDDVSGLSAYSAPHLKCPLEFEFVRSSSELNQGDIKACIRLVEMTSAHDYRESSIGWHPREKMVEMMHKDMMYLLVRQEYDDEGIEMAGQENTEMEGQGAPQLNALEQLIQGYASDTDDEEATTPDTTIAPALAADATLPSPAEPAAIEQTSRATTKKPRRPLPENNGRILGFISFMFTRDDPPHADREVAYIYEIHLREQLRCQGLGSTLIQFVEDAARACEVYKCMLTVFTANGRARLTYGRRGYVKDACSPKARVTRRKVIESEYQIMSKVLK